MAFVSTLMLPISLRKIQREQLGHFEKFTAKQLGNRDQCRYRPLLLPNHSDIQKQDETGVRHPRLYALDSCSPE
jgi:hypothetical protein